MKPHLKLCEISKIFMQIPLANQFSKIVSIVGNLINTLPPVLFNRCSCCCCSPIYCYINVIVRLYRTLKHLSRRWFTLCMNIRNTLAASWTLILTGLHYGILHINFSLLHTVVICVSGRWVPGADWTLDLRIIIQSAIPMNYSTSSLFSSWNRKDISDLEQLAPSMMKQVFFVFKVFCLSWYDF